MAIIFLDSTPCSICGQVLKTDDSIVSWKPFLDESYELWPYSDSGMHKRCFDRWEFKDQFEFLYKFQPLVDFDSPEIRRLVSEVEMPKWLEEIKKFRANLDLNLDAKT